MSNVNDEISEGVIAYLKSTRFILPDITNSQNKIGEILYKSKIEYINILSESFGINVKVHIVYTDSLRSEAITLDNDMYIIHDRYLGQTINMMNRLFLYNSSDHTKIVYLHKIISQIFSRYGFYEESIFAARRYVDSREEMDYKVKQAEDGSQKHALYTVRQEYFILLHELAHLIFKKNPKELNDYSEGVYEWIKKYSSFKDQVSSNLCMDIARRNDLVEEFCCDRFAIVHLVVHDEIYGAGDNFEDIKAIILTFLHLRTIMLIESICSSEQNYDFEKRMCSFDMEGNLYVMFYNMRVHHIKEFCYTMFSSPELEIDEVHAEVSEIMDKHAEEFLSPAISTTLHLLYTASLRNSIHNEFEFIENNIDELSQMVKRRSSAILHLFDYK